MIIAPDYDYASPLPVREIEARYRSRNSRLLEEFLVKSRMREVGIKPFSPPNCGGRQFIHGADVLKLDAVDVLYDFIGEISTIEMPTNAQGGIDIDSEKWPELFKSFWEDIAKKFEPLIARINSGRVQEAPVEILRAHRLLQKAVNEGRKVSTSELAEILEVTHETVRRKTEFDRKGFQFTKVGSGKETMWSVTKIIWDRAEVG